MVSSVSGAANSPYHYSLSLGYGSERTQRSSAQPMSSGASVAVATELTLEQQQLVQQLVQTDRKVRSHEQAHLSVAADLVRGGATFTYQTGPDRRQYAVSGEVSIDVSPARTPADTITKAQRIRAAALAPADPSAQDNRVAALASRMEFDARVALAEQANNAGSDDFQSSDSGALNLSRVGRYLEIEQGKSRGSSLGFGLDLFG